MKKLVFPFLLLPSFAFADGFDSNTKSGSGVDADGTAFVVESVPDTAASASGTDDIAIGDGAVANATAHGVAIGVNADATGENCVAIGS